MILIKTALDWITGNLTRILVLVLVVFVVVAYLLWKNNTSLRIERNQERANIENITKEGARELTLSRSEYEKLNAVWKDKLDSTIKANRIALKSVKSATIIQTQYKDTGSTIIVYKEPIKQRDGLLKIPVSSSTSACWGMEGFLLTTDANAKLDITQRTANNSVQILITRKRFLGFLWWKKGHDIQGFNDCGNIDITQVNYTE